MSSSPILKSISEKEAGVPPRIPSWAGHLLKFAVGGAAIWALIGTGALEPRLLGQAALRHPWLCLAALGVYAATVLLTSWLRWWLLMRLAGLSVGAGRALSLQMIGLFFNSIIPGGTGGDLVKGYYLFREHGEGTRSLALTSIAMDRFAGLYGLLCVAMIMLGLNWELWRESHALRLNSLFYACVFLAFTATIAFFFSPWSRLFLEHPSLHRMPGGKFLKSFSDSLLVYRRRPLGLLLAVGLTMVVDLGLIVMYWLFALSLGMDLPFLSHGFVVPTLTMVNGIPISPAGLGVGEAAGEMLYGTLGVQGGSEVLALVHICILLASLAGAPVYLAYRSRERAGF